ncbi:MAG: hypothetical protein AAFQ07_01945 [Chloroflexota bacterium]
MKQTKSDIKRVQWGWHMRLVWLVLSLAVLACGGTASELLPDSTLDPANQSIGGLPQFVAPSATPEPTHTQIATDVANPIYVPPSGYVTHTPYPGVVYRCNPQRTVCFYATYTPDGGVYTRPGGYVSGATSTPRPTYTPYPSATPCISLFTYYYNEEVFTDPATDTLTLGIALGNVRVFEAPARPDEQIVGWTVEIRNLGRLDYLLFAPFQIFLAGIDGRPVQHFSSEEASRALAVDPHVATLDGFVLTPNQSVRFDMFAYTAVGTPTALAYILDPYANGFDGTIAGGNVAYWIAGDRGACGGRVGADYTPQVNLTPQPSPTATYTPYFRGN